MSRMYEIDALNAEIAAITELLKEADKIGDVLGLHQYSGRIEELEQELERISSEAREQASVSLVFGGRPVMGARGIHAEFAGRILEYFQDLVGKLFAQEELGSLGRRGRVPFERNTALMITGVAHGSFGFTLAEMNDQSEICDTQLKTIVSRASDLMIGATSIDESEFDSQIDTLDPRTIVALKKIFVEMDGQGADIRIREEERETFLDRDAIHRARERIESTEIEEESTLVVGVLKGFLPDHRKFELTDENGVNIYGSATKEAVSQFDTVVLQGGKAIEEKCAAKVQVRTIKPINREPRQLYRLLNFEVLGGDTAPLVQRPE